MRARKRKHEVMSSDSESETSDDKCELFDTSPRRPRMKEDEVRLAGYETLSQEAETKTGTDKSREELALTPTVSPSVDVDMMSPPSMVTPVPEGDIQDSDGDIGDHSQFLQPKSGSTSSTVETRRRKADQGPSLTQLDKNTKRKSKNYAAGSQALIKRFGNQLAKSAKSTPSFVTKAILGGAKKRIQDHFEKIREKSPAHHVWLQEELESAIQMLKDNPNNYQNIFQDLRQKMKYTKIAESSKVRPILKKQFQKAERQSQNRKSMAEQDVEETAEREILGTENPPSSSQTASSAENSEEENATVTSAGIAPMAISVPEVVVQDLEDDLQAFKAKKSSSPSPGEKTEVRTDKGSSSSLPVELIDVDEDQKNESGMDASESHALINEVATTVNNMKMIKAEALLRIGRHNEAQEICTEVLQNDARCPKALYTRALLYYYEDNPDKSIQCARQGLQFAPDNSSLQNMVRKLELVMELRDNGASKFLSGRYDDAKNDYSRCLTLVSDGGDMNNITLQSKLYFNLALIAHKLNKLDESLQACGKAIELNSNYLKAILHRAKIYNQKEMYDDAVHDFEAALRIDPSLTHLRRDIEDAKTAAKCVKGKDYYKILNIEKNATGDEIRKAYKKRALVHHPDRHVNAPEAVQKEQERLFKQLGNAYEVLSDQKKRFRYDQDVGLMGYGGGFNNTYNPSYNDLFNAFFSRGGIPSFRPGQGAAGGPHQFHQTFRH